MTNLVKVFFFAGLVLLLRRLRLLALKSLLSKKEFRLICSFCELMADED